jgi:glycosyltransferase involved in cell wall biosynthesis
VRPGDEGLGYEVAPPGLVTVIVPAYNAEPYIGQSIESLLAQTYEPLEIVVVEDASTDRTAEVIASYDDPRIRCFRNERNLGQFDTLNVGLSKARGELISIHHADDMSLPTMIEHEARWLRERPEVGAAFALDLFIDPEGRQFGRAEPPKEFRGDVVMRYPAVLNGILRYQNVFIRTGTSLVRRELYSAVGPYVSTYDLRGDLDMWLRLASAAPIGIIDEYVTRYRWGHDHLSTRYGHVRTEPERFFDLVDDRLAGGDRALAEPDALQAYEAHRAEDFVMVAVNLYILDRLPEARRMLSRAKARAIAASPRIQRARMLSLWALMHVLVRGRRSRRLADVFYRRWHGADTGERAP